MELTPDASPPPSREVSPLESARRSEPLGLALGPVEDVGELGETDGDQAQQQKQKQDSEEASLLEDVDAAAGSRAAIAGGKASAGDGHGEEAVKRVPGLSQGLVRDDAGGEAEGTREGLESARGATGVGSEPSAEVIEPVAGATSGTQALTAVRSSGTAGTPMTTASRSHSSRGLALLSRGELGAAGSRGIQGIRGISKSFTTGRASPNRQMRSVGTMAVVRETARSPSAHSSRPASSAIAASSVPPSPDPYGSDGQPGTGTISTWPPASALSFSACHAPGSPSPLPLEDVEVRGAAMKILTNSSITREGKEVAATAATYRGLITTIGPSPPPLSMPEVAAASLGNAMASLAPPGTPPVGAGGGSLPLPVVPDHEPSQQISNISSLPSVAMGSTVVAVGRNRPLLMPFLERQAAALAAAAAAGDPAAAGLPPAAAAAMALALAPAVGRRQGSHGSIRHGPAYQQQPPLLGGSSQASGPRDSSSSVAGMHRSALARDLQGTGASPQETPVLSRTPAATADGDPDEQPQAPPLYTTASREWDKPPHPRGSTGAVATSVGPASSYAAGGGAAAVKATVGASGGKAGGTSPDLHLQQQLALGEAIQIRSIHKTGVAPGLDPPSVSLSGMGGLVGVPGRRGRRLPPHLANGSATAATMAAYFANVEASIAEGDKASDKMLLPSGLARRLKAARMMAQGPPPFQRRRELPPPPSPTGIKLDGFMLLEAADEEMPEAVQFASLESRHISAVESADLSYFIALRSLDVSDNKLPDLICLATLQALVRLRAASCRLTTLGRWPGSLNGTDSGAGVPSAKSMSSILRRHRNRKADVGGGAGSNGATEPGETHDSWNVGPDGNGHGDAPAAAAAVGPRSEASGFSDAAAGGGAPAPDGAASPTTESSLVASLLTRINGRPFQFLEILDLSFNQLQSDMVLLPSSPLALLPRLAELDLSSNHLKHLPSPSDIAAAAATGGMAFPSLRRLRLADNDLKSGAIASLAALAPPFLTYLDLSHNAISEAPRLKFLSLNLEDSVNSVSSSNHVTRSATNGLGLNSNTSIGNGNFLSQPVMQKSASQRLQQSSQPRLMTQISSQHLLQPHAQPSPMLHQERGYQERENQERFSCVLTRLTVLDLTFNKITSEGAISALMQLPVLERLLLAGNPLAITAQRPNSQRSPTAASKLDFGEPHAGPSRPTVAASLTARFARIPEAAPKQQANTLAAAASTVITAAAAPERVTEVYDRLDATIEQWRLNTVVEEDEEEDEEEGEEEGGDDRTFLTGVGIHERRHKNSATANARALADGDTMLEAVTEGPAEGQDDITAAPSATSTGAVEERPLWESITDPTERLAVALGLDPLTLPMHTSALTTDSAGAIAALRFALAHPVVEANDGLTPHPGYLAATTAAHLKRKPRRPAPTQRLAPMTSSGKVGVSGAPASQSSVACTAIAAASPKAAKIQTVEAMLEGMKGKLAALEVSLAAQLAAVPMAPSAEAVRRAEAASRARYGGFARRGNETDSDDGDDDGCSVGSGLPEDVIDQIERESDSEDDQDERVVEEEMGPMDPKQGIVLVAEQLGGEASAADISTNAANGNGSNSPPPPVRGGLSSSPPSRMVVSVTSPRTAGVSPRRVNTVASVGGTSSVSPRKGVSIGGTVSVSPTPAVTPVVLPVGAASALGYAS